MEAVTARRTTKLEKPANPKKPANPRKTANPKNTGRHAQLHIIPTSAAKHPSNGWYVAFCLPKACDSAKTTSDTQATRTWYYRNTVRSYSSTAASGMHEERLRRKPHACPNRTSNSGPRCCAITERDASSAELEADGWKVIVVWECELGKKVRDERLERLYREIVDDSGEGGRFRGMTVGRRRCTKRGKNRNMGNVENGAQPQLSKRAQIANRLPIRSAPWCSEPWPMR